MENLNLIIVALIIISVYYCLTQQKTTENKTLTTTAVQTQLLIDPKEQICLQTVEQLITNIRQWQKEL